MNCSSIMCKKPIDDDSSFCKYCGVKQAARQKPVAPPVSKSSFVTSGDDTQESLNGSTGLEIPTPPRFESAPVAEPVVLPADITPTTDFFIYAGTLKIYKGNSDVVVVPEGVTSIGSAVFRDHKNLREVYLPNGVTSISSDAFAGCVALTKINFPDGLNTVGPNAFQGCSSLETAVLPRTVNRIQDKAFQDCSALKEIYLHDTITALPYFAFQNCTSLTRVKLPTMLVVLPEGIFQGCSSLTGIELPDGLKNIEKHAFAQSGLEYITIPLTTINIEEHAFMEMDSLRGITVPKITKIDNYAFVGTNLINKGTIRYIM